MGTDNSLGSSSNEQHADRPVRGNEDFTVNRIMDGRLEHHDPSSTREPAVDEDRCH